MQCATCRAPVPEGALCCVECGRAVSQATVRDARADRSLIKLPTLQESRTPAGPDPMATLADGPFVGVTLEVPDSRSDLARAVAPPVVAPPRPDLNLMPVEGEEVEGYVITGELGRGGMGRVYHAEHRTTGQEVALKMLMPQFASEPRLRNRFLNEAKVLAKLEHINLVPLLGFIEQGPRVFIVMPYIKGITLERMLRRQGRLNLSVALDLFEQVCAAIEHVHRHDVLHRDLKPSNVIVRADGRVVVTDFGIARAIGGEKLTLPGMVVGTAEYLAPEMATGTSQDDKRSDVYSLGILLYEMLTGQVPFQHPNAGEVLQRQVTAPPPPPRGIVPDLPEALEATILRALEKDPADRYQRPTDFAEAARRNAWAREGGSGVTVEPLAAMPSVPLPAQSSPVPAAPAIVSPLRAGLPGWAIALIWLAVLAVVVAFWITWRP